MFTFDQVLHQRESVRKENAKTGNFFTKLMSTLTKKRWSMENLRVVPD